MLTFANFNNPILTMIKVFPHFILAIFFLSGCASFGNGQGDLRNARWSSASAHEGSDIELKVTVAFSCPDKNVTFKIWEKGDDVSSDKPFTVLSAPVNFNSATAKWNYSSEDDNNHSRTEVPQFFFVASCDSGGSSRSGFIQISAVMNVEILDDSGKPLKHEKFRIIGPNGKVYYGKTDENGKCEFSGLIPGLEYKISTE